MSDFTSALYLGIEHGSRQLAGWERLTLGKPAALESPPGAAGVERDLAALVGCERVLLAPSTLHLFWDLLAILSGRNIHLFVDDGLYPIGRWGVERATARGTPATSFRQHDAAELRWKLPAAAARRPVVVADGFCVTCGTPAPLASYLECVAPRDGLVLIDDTQALGILGRGGGGSLIASEIRDRRMILASSLAKAFGAPLAMLGGSDALVAEFEAHSETRVHCSPPSAAAIAAASNALAINRREGDALRWKLAANVARFRRGVGAMAVSAGLFPVQQVALPEHFDPKRIHRFLWDRGVQTVLTRGGLDSGARIAFVLTARHTESEIDHALACLEEVLVRQPRGQQRRHLQWHINR